MVSIGPAAAYRPHAAAAAAVLTDFFADINHRDYRAYRNLLIPALRRVETLQRIRAGYPDTTDSRVRLDRLTTAAAGRLVATVAFVSHQSPASSPDHAACDTWRITLILVPRDGGYLIGRPLPGYPPHYQPCR